MDQVEYLELELATIKSEKQSIEREYEKSSWQVSDLLYNWYREGGFDVPLGLINVTGEGGGAAVDGAIPGLQIQQSAMIANLWTHSQLGVNKATIKVKGTPVSLEGFHEPFDL